MQARFYAPMYGRFLSPDPARDQHFEETQSWNIYSYVQNNPTMKIDPTGMIINDIYFNMNGHMVDNVETKQPDRVFVENQGGSVSHDGRTFNQVDTTAFNQMTSLTVAESLNKFDASLALGKMVQNIGSALGAKMDSTFLSTINVNPSGGNRFTSTNPDSEGDKFRSTLGKTIEERRTTGDTEGFRGAVASLSNKQKDTSGGAEFNVSKAYLDKHPKGFHAAAEKSGKLTRTAEVGKTVFFKRTNPKKDSL